MKRIGTKPLPVLKGCLGLNTRIDPTRIPVNENILATSLAEAVDVVIDSSYRVSRRKGYVATSRTESIHSLFCDGGDCLYVDVVQEALYRLNVDYSRTGIRSGINPSARMWYAQVGEEIYYSNGFQNGRYVNATSYPWVALPYVGPETVKTFSDPPVAEHLQLYNGRLFMSVDSTIWYTEPFAYSWVDMARNFIPFSSRIVMIRAVVDGLYVSTDRSIYFLGGPDPQSFTVKTVAEYPAIEGTDCYVDGSLVGEGVAFKVAMWTALTGICVGLPGGDFKNTTDKRIVLPVTVTGAGGFVNGKYITTLEP